VEVTQADLGMLVLADGHRTVREIAERVRLAPAEVARHFAKFRLAGVLELVKTPAKSAMAA
jgi:DNA-binding Lrp family transcriptional regulator